MAPELSEDIQSEADGSAAPASAVDTLAKCVVIVVAYAAAASSSDIFLVSFLLPHSAPLGAVPDHFDSQMPTGSSSCRNFWPANFAGYRSFLVIDH